MSNFNTFMSLIRDGDVDGVVSTFQTEYLSMTDEGGLTPLHVACGRGTLETVKFLCEQNCDIEASSSDNYRPIHLACKHCHIDIVKYLCQKRCLIEVVTKSGQSVLDLAIQNGRHDIHKFLSEEILKRQLIRKIADMQPECDDRCDHSFCLKGIQDTKSKSEALLGRGSFGSVFKMKDPGLNYTFCIKSIYLDPSASNQKEKHIEFNINNYAHSIYHERVVQYFGTRDNGQDMYIFMEYVEGEEHVKICDFGLSCYLASIGQRSQTQATESSNIMTFCGTPNYMAPEIITGQPYSYPVDIWGLGATIVEMLTGKPPFCGMKEFKVIMKIGKDQKIEFVPAEPMSENMKSFVDQMLRSPLHFGHLASSTLLDFALMLFTKRNNQAFTRVHLRHEEYVSGLRQSRYQRSPVVSSSNVRNVPSFLRSTLSTDFARLFHTGHSAGGW